MKNYNAAKKKESPGSFPHVIVGCAPAQNHVFACKCVEEMGNAHITSAYKRDACSYLTPIN